MYIKLIRGAAVEVARRYKLDCYNDVIEAEINTISNLISFLFRNEHGGKERRSMRLRVDDCLLIADANYYDDLEKLSQSYKV